MGMGMGRKFEAVDVEEIGGKEGTKEAVERASELDGWQFLDLILVLGRPSPNACSH
jgi:hypothetical protein